MIHLLLPAECTRRLSTAVGEGELTIKLLLDLGVVLALLAALSLMAVGSSGLLGVAAHPGSTRVLLAFIALVLWLSLMGTSALAWSAGAFDRLLHGRTTQAVAVTALISLLAGGAGDAAMRAVGA